MPKVNHLFCNSIPFEEILGTKLQMACGLGFVFSLYVKQSHSNNVNCVKIIGRRATPLKKREKQLDGAIQY